MVNLSVKMWKGIKMSGGSWGYVYRRVEEVSETLLYSKCPYRKALGVHLSLIAEALHDIEWVDSADYSPGDEIESIKKVISMEKVLEKSLIDAKKMIEEINEIILACEKSLG